MFNETKEIFSDDYIKVGNKKIRPFSIAWWIVRGAMALAAIVSMYVIYCAIWMISSLFGCLASYIECTLFQRTCGVSVIKTSSLIKGVPYFRRLV